jgi:malate dehydrogenase
MKPVIKVLVTGAAGNIAYSLIGMIAKGDVFGFDQPVQLNLLDIPLMAGVLEGVVMELEDGAYPLLHKVLATVDEKEAFTDIDVAFLVGAMPRKEGMERKDLLAANVKIFKSQGKALDTVAKKSVKVLVVGNPANTNCLIARKYAPSIPSENFSALTRLDMNRAKAQIAKRLNVLVKDVRRCVIWGNHSNTQFADVAHAVVNVNGVEIPVPQAVKDDAWIEGEFLKTIQVRGAAVIKARKLSSALSAANAAADHMHDWWIGAPDWVCMAVLSDGSYGVPEDLIFSFPVTIDSSGKYKIVQGVPMSDFAKGKMDVTTKELLEERESALEVCKD